MKIAVLFGSFNPLTNSHLAVMKTAVDSLQADLGLFVATNGQYLKRKTVKINNPFYLTEEERRETIEKAIENEDKLSFWGYELGGMIPSRFKTLCKIQKQYPEAEIYEIMGADKIRTLLKSTHGEEYVGAFKFAVFARNGIDVEGMFDENPILGDHRDSFVFLPALEEGATISSTEVRRRFYAGEDYSDLVPVSTVEVMSRHEATDFSIAFADRIQTMIKSSRFGPRNARKEVYKENTKMFHAWKEGKAELELGDYQAFLDGAKLYKKAFDVNGMGTIYESSQMGCINADCMDVAQYLLGKGYNPAILNLASAKRPCGGWDEGMGAQEESLCFSSTLSVSLYQYGDPKYKNVRASGVPLKEIGYPHDMNHGGIYSKNVTFFRNNISMFYTLRDEPFKCDVITVAGLCFNGKSHYAGIDEMSFRAADGGFTTEGEEIMLNKIRTIFRMAVEHGKDSIILGALACGAYKCPPNEVAKQYKMVIEEPEFKNKFKLLVFAILEKAKAPHGLEGHFAPFYREFGEYRLED